MNCKKCGQPLDSRYKVCAFCGEPIPSITNQETMIFEECAKGLTDTEADGTEPEEQEPTLPKRKRGRRAKREKVHQDSSGTEPDLTEDAEGYKEKWNPGPLIAGIMITLALIGAAAFAGYYAYNHFMGQSTETYVESLTTISDDIDDANMQVVKALKTNEKELPVSEVQSGISKAYTAFNSIIGDFDKIAPPSVYSDSNGKLGEAINLNKTIYQNIQAILKNPADPQTGPNLSRLPQQIDQCMALYTSLGIKDVDFSLPNEIISISSKIEPWVKQKQTEYAQVTKLIDSYTKYFNSMMDIFVKYDASKADFNATLKNVKGGTASWDDLFALLDKSESQLKAIKTDYGKLSVPTDLKTINKDFAPILDDSLVYISKFRFAAQTEKAFLAQKQVTVTPTATPTPGQSAGIGQNQGNKTPGQSQTVLTPEQNAAKTAEISALYQDSEKSNSSAALAYQKYLVDFNAAKNNFLDPEYVLKLKGKK